MIETVASSSISREVGDVFAFVAEVDNFPKWVRGAHVRPLSTEPFGEGTRFQEGNVVVRVCRFHLNASFETESVAIQFPLSLVLQHTHGMLRFEPTEQGTRFTFVHQVGLTRLANPLRSMVARRAQQDTQAAVEQLRNVLETL